MKIEVNDIVIWRSGKSTSKTILPIGVANCKVVQLGEGPSGEACAQITLPEGVRRTPHIADLGIDLHQPIWTLVADLEK